MRVITGLLTGLLLVAVSTHAQSGPPLRAQEEGGRRKEEGRWRREEGGWRRRMNEEGERRKEEGPKRRRKEEYGYYHPYQ